MYLIITLKFPKFGWTAWLIQLLSWAWWIPKLTSWAHSNLNFLKDNRCKTNTSFWWCTINLVCLNTKENTNCYYGPKVIFESIAEASHEVWVSLHRWSSFQNRKTITPQWDVFFVSLLVSIGIWQVWNLIHLLKHPLWQRNPGKEGNCNH